jgi:hypothetical protein
MGTAKEMCKKSVEVIVPTEGATLSLPFTAAGKFTAWGTRTHVVVSLVPAPESRSPVLYAHVKQYARTWTADFADSPTFLREYQEIPAKITAQLMDVDGDLVGQPYTIDISVKQKE